jgi:hypothetical protein
MASRSSKKSADDKLAVFLCPPISCKETEGDEINGKGEQERFEGASEHIEQIANQRFVEKVTVGLPVFIPTTICGVFNGFFHK